MAQAPVELDPLDVEPLLRLHDVTRRLQVTRPTVRKLMQHGGLRFMRIGRELRFKREWLEDFIEKTGLPGGRSRKRRRSS